MYSFSELLHFPNLKNVEKSKFPVHFQPTVMILIYDIYKTIREFDNSPGLHSVITDLLHCCLSLHFFRSGAFILLLSFFNIGHEGSTPHSTPAPSLHARRIYSSYYSIAKSLKHLSVKGRKLNKGFVNPLVTKLGARPCFSLPLNLGCCAKYSAVPLRSGQMEAKDWHCMASHSLWSNPAAAV